MKPSVAPICFAAIVAGAITLLATHRGVGLSPDSAAYWRIAKTFAGEPPPHVEGFDPPVTLAHYPPLLPAILAGFVKLHFSVAAAGRTLAVALAMINAALLASLARTRFTRLLAILAAGCFPFSFIGPMLWSEPLFFVFVTLAVAALSRVSRESRVDPQTASGTGPALAVATLAIAAAMLTRYAGVFLLPLLLTDGRRVFVDRRRWVAVLVALAPMVTWVAFASHGDVAGRQLSVRFDVSMLLEFGMTAALSAMAWIAIFSLRTNATHRLGRLAATAAVSCFATLLFARIFVDQHTPLDARILSPIGLLGWVTLISLPTIRERWWNPILLILLALVFFRGVVDFRDSIKGRDYAAASWRASPTLQAARSLPREAIVFTNAPDVLVLLADRDALLLPRRLDPASGWANEAYAAQMRQMKTLVESGNASIVWFDRLAKRTYLPTAAEMREIVGEDRVLATGDGWFAR